MFLRLSNYICFVCWPYFRISGVREDFVSVHSSGSHERMIRTWNGNDGNVPLFKKYQEIQDPNYSSNMF